MTVKSDGLSAQQIAQAITDRKLSALEATEAALARIAAHDGVLNSFTDVTADRARATAKAIDTKIAAGESVGPLAGVPFAVKNLFDVAGLPTLAGSKINRDRAPAVRDATVIARLEAAGAVLVGTVLPPARGRGRGVAEHRQELGGAEPDPVSRTVAVW